MGFDLNRISGTPPPGPIKPAKSGFDLSRIDSSSAGMSAGEGPGAPEDLDMSKFRFQPKIGVDNYLLRAQDQGVWEQAAKTVGNAVANTFTGLIEGVGYLPEMLDDQHDYSNALTRKMQQLHNPFGEVYQKHPDQMFDLGSSGWWFNSFRQLAESAGSFALEGIGLAKVFGGLAKGAATLADLSKLNVVRKGLMAGAEVASAATLAYTEGAMSGYQIYNDSYKSNYEKSIANGKSAEEADQIAQTIASHAAATTVHLNTIINTVFNLGELSPLFKEPTDEVLHFLKTEGLQGANETRAAWRTRLKELTFENPTLKNAITPRHGLTSRGAEALKEGVEEINTQYAEHEGRRVSDNEGKTRSLSDALTDVGQYFSDVTDQEGALNFVLGAIGGVAQTAIIDHIPSRYIAKMDSENKPILKTNAEGKIIYGKDGQPKMQMQLVTPKTYTEFGTKRYFENIRDSITGDIDHIEGLHAQLATAVATKNEAEAGRLRNELFSVGALDAVSKGLTPSWAKYYQQIAEVDNKTPLSKAMQPQVDELTSQMQEAFNTGTDQTKVDELNKERQALVAKQATLEDTTDAMQRGLARDMSDHEYVTRAQQAVTDLAHLQELHKTIQHKYAEHEDPISGELADHLFFRHADLYLRQQAINREQMRIDKMETLQRQGNVSDVVFDDQVRRYNEHIGVQNATLDQLNKDVQDLKDADKKGDQAKLKELIAKYRAVGVNDDDIPGAVDDLMHKITLKSKQYSLSVSEARKNLEEGTGYQAWKLANPQGNFEDYRKTFEHNSLLQSDKANLEAVKAAHSIANQNLQELMSVKGHERILKALAEDKGKMIRSINERNKQTNLDNFLAIQSQQSAAKLNAKDKKIAYDQLTRQLSGLQTQLAGKIARVRELQTQINDNKGKGFFRNIASRIGVNKELQQVRAERDHIQALIHELTDKQASLGYKVQEAQVQAAKTQTLTNDDLKDTDKDLNEDAEPIVEDIAHDPVSDAAQSDHQDEDLIATPGAAANPVERYAQLKETMPDVILSRLDRLEEYFTGKPLSFTSFLQTYQEAVTRGMVTRQQVTDAWFAFRDYMEHQEKMQPGDRSAVELVAESAAQAAQDPAMQEQEVITPEQELADATPADVESDQPAIQIQNEWFSDETIAEDHWTNTAKTVDAVKANSSDLLYSTLKVGNRLVLTNKMQDDGPILDPKANHDRMIPGKIAQGDKVYLQVDTAWEGTVTTDEGIVRKDYKAPSKADKYEDYLDHEGKIRMDNPAMGYANMPIKVVHEKTGKTIGYLPRVDWINQTQGADNYRNVVDEVDDNAGNIDQQTRINMEIRRRLAIQHNQDTKARMNTVISERTPGQVMYAGDVTESTGRIKYKSLQTKTQLPDPALNFGAVTKDGPMIGKGVKAATRMNLVEMNPNQLKDMIGAPVVYLPMPNGQHKVVPLDTIKFSQRASMVNTMQRVIELYFQAGTPHLDAKGQSHVDAIKQKTGFDVTTEDGLKNFIEQYYTHTTDFADGRTAGSAAAINGEKIPKFMLSIPQRKSGIKAAVKVGVTYSGQRPIYAQLVNGKLDPKFVAAFTAGISGRFKTVNFTHGSVIGVNDASPIATITIDKNDRLSSTYYNNYNEYLRSFTSTTVYGRHQVAGKYVYAANSQVILNQDSLLPTTPDRSALELVATPAGAQPGGLVEQEDHQDAADILDDLSNMSYQPKLAKTSIQPKGDVLNLDSLTELHTFTSADERNGKTPKQVLAYLQSLGITKLADGYNPFIKC